jgi:hypothetical protein
MNRNIHRYDHVFTRYFVSGDGGYLGVCRQTAILNLKT